MFKPNFNKEKEALCTLDNAMKSFESLCTDILSLMTSRKANSMTQTEESVLHRLGFLGGKNFSTRNGSTEDSRQSSISIAV